MVKLTDGLMAPDDAQERAARRSTPVIAESNCPMFAASQWQVHSEAAPNPLRQRMLENMRARLLNSATLRGNLRGAPARLRDTLRSAET
jgi:hypothetical protein